MDNNIKAEIIVKDCKMGVLRIENKSSKETTM